MRLRGHRELDVSKPLYAKRAFTLGDKAYAVGDVVQTSAVPPRRLRQLHDQRKLGHEKPNERTGAEGRWQSKAQQPPAAAKKSPPQPRR